MRVEAVGSEPATLTSSQREHFTEYPVKNLAIAVEVRTVDGSPRLFLPESAAPIERGDCIGTYPGWQTHLTVGTIINTRRRVRVDARPAVDDVRGEDAVAFLTPTPNKDDANVVFPDDSRLTYPWYERDTIKGEFLWCVKKTKPGRLPCYAARRIEPGEQLLCHAPEEEETWLREYLSHLISPEEVQMVLKYTRQRWLPSNVLTEGSMCVFAPSWIRFEYGDEDVTDDEDSWEDSTTWFPPPHQGAWRRPPDIPSGDAKLVFTPGHIYVASMFGSDENKLYIARVFKRRRSTVWMQLRDGTVFWAPVEKRRGVHIPERILSGLQSPANYFACDLTSLANM